MIGCCRSVWELRVLYVIKRIPVEALTVGMRVVRLDRSWLETPFWRHRIDISQPAQIEMLKAQGIRFVDIEADDTPQEATISPAASLNPVPWHTPAAGHDEPLEEPDPIQVPFEEELPRARLVYQEAKRIVQDAMHDARLGRAIDMEAVNRVVSAITDSIFRNLAALTSLSRLKKYDEYTFYHSVNTAVLSVALGRNLRWDRGSLQQLGIGTLLHDIGKTRIPIEILNKPGRLESDEFEIVKQHVLRGVEILSATTGLTDTHLRPALEHHERVDGTGYPFQRRGEQLSEFGLIAAVVDIYDAISSDRCYHRAMTPHAALQFLYGLGQRGHLDGILVQRFIQIVGVYPVGSCLLLTTGELAVVSKTHPRNPTQPVVLIVRDQSSHRMSKPLEVDLAADRSHPSRSVDRVIDPSAIGWQPADYLDGELAA
jgi:HD-GYP domain-containing protein (c-di-GMP phosphodiesterase class II)